MSAHARPPQPNRVDGEFGRVMSDADAHPALIVGQVIDPIGNRFPEGGVPNVMHADRAGLPVRPPRAAAVLETATNSFFLVSTEIAGSPCCWHVVIPPRSPRHSRARVPPPPPIATAPLIKIRWDGPI